MHLIYRQTKMSACNMNIAIREQPYKGHYPSFNYAALYIYWHKDFVGEGVILWWVSPE